jgi:predicted transcriptional regulator
MTHKERVLLALGQMPDDCSYEEMIEKIEFLAGVQAGLDALDRGEEVDHEVIKKKFASWASA